MNQRAKRGSKKNRTDHIAVATGGWTARQSTNAKVPDEVNVEPAKVTEKPSLLRRGLAKASPVFKKIEAKELPSVDDQKKALAENAIKSKAKTSTPKKVDEDSK